jgi:hypothetical protein
MHRQPPGTPVTKQMPTPRVRRPPATSSMRGGAHAAHSFNDANECALPPSGSAHQVSKLLEEVVPQRLPPAARADARTSMSTSVRATPLGQGGDGRGGGGGASGRGRCERAGDPGERRTSRERARKRASASEREATRRGRRRRSTTPSPPPPPLPGPPRPPTHKRTHPELPLRMDAARPAAAATGHPAAAGAEPPTDEQSIHCPRAAVDLFARARAPAGSARRAPPGLLAEYTAAQAVGGGQQTAGRAELRRRCHPRGRGGRRENSRMLPDSLERCSERKGNRSIDRRKPGRSTDRIPPPPRATRENRPPAAL